MASHILLRAPSAPIASPALIWPPSAVSSVQLPPRSTKLVRPCWAEAC